MIVKKPTPFTVPGWLTQLPSSIALFDQDFCLVDSSDQWNQKFAFKDDQIQGKSLFRLFPNLSDDWHTKLDYVLEGLKDIQIIEQMASETGSPQSLIWYLNPWVDGYGNIIGVVTDVKDITETKKLRLELNRANEQLKEKGKIAKIGSWEYEVAKDEFSVSPNVKTIFKFENSLKLPSKRVLGFCKPGDSRKRLQSAIRKAIDNGISWDEDIELIPKNGRALRVNIIGRPKFKNGKCTRILGTIQDITDKVSRSEKRVDRQPGSQSYFHQVFSIAPASMAIIDYATGRIIDVNRSLVKITGYTRMELIGKSYRFFPFFGKRANRSTVLGKLISTGEFESREIGFKAKNGNTFSLNIHGRLLTHEKSKQVVITVEAAPQPKKEAQLLRKRLLAAEKDIDKLVNFAHMVSHNLKSHATNLTLLLEFLDKETREDGRKKLLGILKGSSKNLSETIKGLREIVAIRNNKKIEKEPLVLNDFIFRAEQRLMGQIKKENAKIVNEIDDNMRVRAFPAYLMSILINCLSNAIKFRKPGKKAVIILSASSDPEYTILSIEDNGIGIDLKKDGNRLFGLYETLGNATESRGMGLYLTKYQVELMNGRIEVDSSPGQGSVFKIFFPNQ